MGGANELADGLALSVHGPAGVVDLRVPAGALVRDVAREYAAHARLGAEPELRTTCGSLLSPDLVLAEAEKYDLDPLLMFALIRQESLFEGFAVSSASAQGLMQIWPPTGEDIAAQLAWPDYRPSDLQRPFVNVAFGTWLLRDELDRFNNDKYAVLAAYNAGSGRALSWQQESQGDPDLFLELINMTEPRIYIERIFENYAAYRELYGAPQVAAGAQHNP